MARRDTGGWVTLALLAGVLSAPLVVFIAVFGLRFGWWGLDFARDRLSFLVAPCLLGLGALATLILVWRARRTGATGWLLALGSAVIVAGGFALLYANFVHQYPDGTASLDVSTDPAEPPVFSARVQSLHAGSDVVACPGVSSIPSQVLAEDATAALQRAGFTPLPSSLFRVEGTHEGMWFLLQHDATIRIRPGQTDIRVAARNTRPNGGETCRLLARIVEELQPRS